MQPGGSDGRWPLRALAFLAVAIGFGLVAGLGWTDAEPSTERGGQWAQFHDDGISFDYPASWRLHRTDGIEMRGSTIAIVGTADLSACGGPSVPVNCAYGATLRPGDIQIFVGTAASPVNTFLEQAPPGGFTDLIDGMPAVVRSTGPIPQTASDENRMWSIGMPGQESNWYVVEATMRGPDLTQLRDVADAVARSMRFDNHVAPLPTDPAAIDAIVKSTVDALDRDARESYHSTYYECFPRHVGSSEPTVIKDGPGGPLVGPIEVRCAISVEPEPVRLFEVTFAASWEAGPGYAAGTYREVHEVAADGTLGGGRSFNDTFFPETAPKITPAPAETPIALAAGSLAEVLFPGVVFYLTPDRNGDMLNDLPHGERLWIVDGPQRVDGEDWYRVQWTPTPTYGGIPGWMPATLDGHPVVEPVGPRCADPVDDVVDLVRLHPAERLACFADRPITLGPVILEPSESDTHPTAGTPPWLADTPTVAMFGSDGPDGVDGPLLVRADPSLGKLPLRSWLSITGHFDDPAAKDCTRSWAGDAGSAPSPESEAEQVLGCREQFVITKVTAARAP